MQATPQVARLAGEWSGLDYQLRCHGGWRRCSSFLAGIRASSQEIPGGGARGAPQCPVRGMSTGIMVHSKGPFMPKPTLYIETSIVSYLTAFGSRDLVLAAHQELTRGWWESRDTFRLFASQVVIEEASAGDVGAASRRLDALRDIPLLNLTDDALQLASRLVRDGGLPQKARLDAFHVAIATVHGMDYLLTWNCKHIANATLRGKIENICKAAGYQPAIICTPFELPKD